MKGTDGASARRTPPAWGKALVVLGMLALALGLVRTARAQAPETPAEIAIADVVVYGNRSIPTDKILGYFAKMRVGLPFSYAALQEDVAKLSETRLFREVSADKKIQFDERSG